MGGDPLPEVSWSKLGGRLPAGRSDATPAIPAALPSGAQSSQGASAQLLIQRSEPDDAGVYVCTAKNAAGTATANATLSVYCKYRHENLAENSK